MNDYFNILANGRQPQYFGKLKMTSKCSKWKTTSVFWQMENDLNILSDGRRPEYVDILKATSMFSAHGR
jgi:hypothetical protein